MQQGILLNAHRIIDSHKNGNIGEYSMVAALRHWVLLIKLNGLFVLFSLPIITLPATYCASVDIMHDLLRDKYREPFMLARFSATFRRSFSSSILAGFIFAFLMITCFSSIYFYGILATVNLLYSVFCALAFALAIISLLVGCYFYTALSIFPALTFRQLMMVALYSTLLKPWPPLFGIGMTALIWTGHLLSYPYSIFLPMFISASIGILILTFSSVKGVNLGYELLHSKTTKI